MLIVGLGNVGRQFEKTYHNVGFMCIEELAKFLGATWGNEKCDAIVAETRVNNQRVVLAKPVLYMNLSGVSVRKLMKKYGFDISEVIVICDDIDMEVGKVRHKEHGSGGTHNGLKNIVHETGSTEFHRFKIGVGRPPEYMELADFVLSKIDAERMAKIEPAINEVVDRVTKMLN